MQNDALLVAMATGTLAVIGSLITGMFLWAKNQADAALSISKASASLVDQLDHRREKDLARLERQAGKIHTQELVINHLLTWVQAVSVRLRESGIDNVPPPPEVTIDLWGSGT